MKVNFKKIRDCEVYFEIVSDDDKRKNFCVLSCCGDTRGHDLNYKKLEKVILDLYDLGIDGFDILY